MSAELEKLQQLIHSKNIVKSTKINLAVSDCLEEMEQRFAKLSENINNNNETLGQLKQNIQSNNKIIEELILNVKNNNIILGDLPSYRQELSQLEENVRNNNSTIKNLIESKADRDDTSSQIDNIWANLVKIKKSSTGNPESNASGNPAKENAPREKVNASAIQDKDTYSSIDYFDFENHFRGSREKIKENQKQYLPYFDGCKNVLDLGCGRGEFLELLKDNGIGAVGVDNYQEFVDFCQFRDLNVVYCDALDYLQSCESTDGIFLGQVVEHMKIDQIVKLCHLIYEKLEEGRYAILETPNPMSLAIYSQFFYVDPSHNKPIHPYTLKYIMEKAGFKKIEILFTESSKMDVSIPKISGVENCDEFNKSMEIVQNTLFGSQDYAIIVCR